MFIKADIDAGVCVPGQFIQGFQDQHAQEVRALGVGLGVLFAFLQAFDFNLVGKVCEPSKETRSPPLMVNGF